MEDIKDILKQISFMFFSSILVSQKDVYVGVKMNTHKIFFQFSCSDRLDVGARSTRRNPEGIPSF